MRILVTGGAGFIASHVADAYIAAGHEVMVIDNLSAGKREFVNPKARFAQVDITDRPAVEQIMAKFRPEVLNHHAAHIQVGYSVKDPAFDATQNILGTINLMQAGTTCGLKQVITASTGGVMYGNQPTPFREDMLPDPMSPYPVSKRSSELYLRYFWLQYGIAATILRYANVYGPRQNPHGESGVVSIFIEHLLAGKIAQINGEGTTTRDYVYVADVVDANLRALGRSDFGIFNIGTGIKTSTNQVFEKVVAALQATGVELGALGLATHGPARLGEQPESALDSSLAQKVLGWQPHMSFDQGIQKVVDWYQGK